MNVNVNDQVLRIDGCRELSGATARLLLDAVRSAPHPWSTIEIDLSEIATMDCRGVGALVSVRNFVRDRASRLRVLNPSVVVERVLDATCSTHLFEIRPSGRSDSLSLAGIPSEMRPLSTSRPFSPLAE